MRKINKTPLATAIGVAVISTFAANSANAEVNPFGMTELSQGYMQLADAGDMSMFKPKEEEHEVHHTNAEKPATAKPAEIKPADAKPAEIKPAEASCGGMMEGGKMKPGMEAACGAMMKGKEGACGMMPMGEKAKEGACGEGMKMPEDKGSTMKMPENKGTDKMNKEPGVKVIPYTPAAK